MDALRSLVQDVPAKAIRLFVSLVILGKNRIASPQGLRENKHHETGRMPSMDAGFYTCRQDVDIKGMCRTQFQQDVGTL